MSIVEAFRKEGSIQEATALVHGQHDFGLDKNGRAKETGVPGGRALKAESTGVTKGLDGEMGWRSGYRKKKKERAKGGHS